MKRLGLVALALLCCSCTNVQFHTIPLPTFDKAVNRTEWTGVTRIFDANEVEFTALPELAPYAVVHATSNARRRSLSRQFWEKANSLRADVALVHDEPPAYLGSVSTYIGFGVTTST